MHAYLITGGTQEMRLAEVHTHLTKASVSPFDTTYLRLAPEEEHIGIDAVRVFKKQLLLAPQQSPFSAGVVEMAHTLTVEAQNALLKLLEEPPPHAIMYVASPSADLLLDTIVSRCQLIHLADTVTDEKTIEEAGKTIRTLMNAKMGGKLAVIDGIAKDRVLAKAWTATAIVAARETLLEYVQSEKSPEDVKKIATLTRRLVQAQKELAANVNPKLVLDTVFYV